MPIKNYDKLYYTFCHRQAFRYVLETRFADAPCYDELCERADAHDLDKALYLSIGDKKEASAYHRATNSHHMENNLPKDLVDLYEAAIDYECAGFTKADKPLNAYDTLQAYKKPHADEIYDILEDMGICRSYENTPYDEEWIAWQRERWVEPTEDVVMDWIEWFCEKYPEWAREVRIAAGDVGAEE